mgnify:CR=1 FL=1
MPIPPLRGSTFHADPHMANNAWIGAGASRAAALADGVASARPEIRPTPAKERLVRFV